MAASRLRNWRVSRVGRKGKLAQVPQNNYGEAAAAAEERQNLSTFSIFEGVNGQPGSGWMTMTWMTNNNRKAEHALQGYPAPLIGAPLKPETVLGKGFGGDWTGAASVV